MNQDKDSKKEYFVYCFMDPRKPGKYLYDDIELHYEPIYIGKGKGNRPKRHLTLYKKNKNRFYSKIKKIISEGFKPIILLLKENLTEKESFIYEKNYIEKIGRIENGGVLTNLSDGGEGQSGFKFSNESREKMSIQRKGIKLGPMSEENKVKISLAKIGKSISTKNKKLEEIVGVDKAIEIKEKLSNIGKERVGEKNPMYGKRHSDESKEKMSKNICRRFGTDNHSYGRERKEEEKVYDTWELTNKEGEIIIIENLSKFCRENGLNVSCMRDVYYGNSKGHKNWIKVNKLTNNVKKKKLD
jgi:hypothetical protein